MWSEEIYLFLSSSIGEWCLVIVVGQRRSGGSNECGRTILIGINNALLETTDLILARYQDRSSVHTPFIVLTFSSVKKQTLARFVILTPRSLTLSVYRSLSSVRPGSNFKSIASQ
jgi:hypothetical protein